MHEQALYVVDHRGRYQYIWAGSAAKAREKAAASTPPVPAGAPYQHHNMPGDPRGIAGAAPPGKIGIGTMNEN
jgi:hypothetical protein